LSIDVKKMSLTIKLERVYQKIKADEKSKGVKDIALAVRGNKETNALLLSKEAFIECKCKVRFRQTKQERTLTRANSTQVSFASRAAISDTEHDDHNDEERKKFIAKTNETVIFGLASGLRNDESIEVECYKRERFKNK
jgi:hypothetical protein